jgi:hypothetical protein
MTPSQPRRIILTHWNAGVFKRDALPQLIPELVVFSLLYDEVLIREEDLLTNRSIIALLSDDAVFSIFEELLAAGIVRLLRLPLQNYPPGRRYDPVRLPISARAEEHELRRTYRGRPWKPTANEWRFFARLDEVVVHNPASSRFHTDFAPRNLFADELAEVLENRHAYRLRFHPVFRYIPSETADSLIRFCREPGSWLRFLHDAGITNPIVGPDGGFYRSAAYQCFELLPAPRSTRRLVESVYAATYCDREQSDGRYGGSELIELPYHSVGREDAESIASATKINVVPTSAAANITVAPGIAAVLQRTRESSQFRSLATVLERLGNVDDEKLPTEGQFYEAWRQISEVYADSWAHIFRTPSTFDKLTTRYSIAAYVGARVLGFVIFPEAPWHLDVPVLQDAIAIASIEHFGPRILSAFRATLRAPRLQDELRNAARIRCSKVALNTA